MKKSIIAAGAASVALAAMPIVGAFATTSVKDSITAAVQSGCTISNEADSGSEVATNTISITAAPGVASEDVQSTNGISITCNSNAWHVSAVGAGSEGHLTDLYDATANAKIETGTTFNGSTSAWGFKITSTAGDVSSGFDGYHVIPDTETTIVSGTSAASATVKATYKVYAASNQPTGDAYNGAVTFTVGTGAGA